MAAPKNHLTGDAAFPIKTLRCIITVGATGAVSSVAGYGVTAVTRTSTGLYNIVLDQAYAALLGVSGVNVASTLDDLGFSVKAEDVDDASDPEVDLFVFEAAAGTVVDPAEGSKLLIRIEVLDTLT